MQRSEYEEINNAASSRHVRVDVEENEHVIFTITGGQSW
jgi:hypothetical protein